MAPLVSHIKELGLIEAVAVKQTPCFEAGVTFARAEGIVPAPESTHAVRVAVDEALKCKQEGTARTILFNLSGHGHFDMQAYADYFAGKLEDRDYDEAALAGRARRAAEGGGVDGRCDVRLHAAAAGRACRPRRRNGRACRHTISPAATTIRTACRSTA